MVLDECGHAMRVERWWCCCCCWRCWAVLEARVASVLRLITSSPRVCIVPAVSACVSYMIHSFLAGLHSFPQTHRLIECIL
jgi:hypothetical protein